MSDRVKVTKLETNIRITESYIDPNNQEQIIGVYLKLNYERSTYSIKDVFGNNPTFDTLNPKNGAQKAIAKCILAAIDLANEQLELHKFSESNTNDQP